MIKHNWLLNMHLCITVWHNCKNKHVYIDSWKATYLHMLHELCTVNSISLSMGKNNHKESASHYFLDVYY